MVFETPATIPTRNIKVFTEIMTKAGWTVTDTGHRIMTDEGPEGDTTLILTHISRVDIEDADVSHGVET